MVKSLASKTGQVIYRQKGKPGDKGARLRMRDWSASQSYLRGSAGEEWYDVVLYKDLLYLCVKSHTSSSANNPQTSVANNLGYWEKAQDWTFVATKLLLAERIKAEDIDADNLVAKNVDIEGKITANGGVFKNIRSPNDSFRIKENGDIEIVGKVSTSFNGTRIEIDSETNSIKMYNTSNKEIGSLKFIESTINGLTDYIPRFRISRYVGDTMYDQVDINSGSLFIQNTLAGNTYSVLINPSYGIEFLKNNVQTKKYPNI